jgi:26S proteasome regulatory subunit T2
VSSAVGPEYYVSILSFVDKTQLEPGCSVLLHNKVMSVVGILQDETDPMVSVMKVGPGGPRRGVAGGSRLWRSRGVWLAGSEQRWARAGVLKRVLRRPRARPQVDKAPTESYADVGGLESQITEIKEAVELPLTHPELYEDIGIKPPKVRRRSGAAGGVEAGRGRRRRGSAGPSCAALCRPV